ncbi:DNA-directed RNA polymerase subunit K [Candidatus Woesearchaeota archaeon]|nr:DNA-directed RNA polymerase subunit K [Candidatus Woesearchaeota archaeon]
MAKKQQEKNETYSKYEKARMIGSRALQIAMGAPFIIKLSDKDLKKLAYNPIGIAKLEFEKGVIPITVKRPLPSPKE